MKARPILFSGPMMRALLEGRKTQTRRIVKDQPPPCKGFPREANGEWGIYLDRPHAGPYKHLGKCPYGKPGDLLWVREAWQQLEVDGTNLIAHRIYTSGNHFLFGLGDLPQSIELDRWRPSIHMPRWVSRLTLELTDVWVERLQEISGLDPVREGVVLPPEIGKRSSEGRLPQHLKNGYREIWESINGKGSWDANPWVWVLTFKVHQENVDALLKARAA